MTTDQIIYFLNHLADRNVSSNISYLQGLTFIGIPGVLALVIVLIGMKKVRGKKNKLNIYVALLYVASVFSPAALIVNSVIYLQQYGLIIPGVLVSVFFGLLYTLLIQDFYNRYNFKTDADYLKAFPLPDGRNKIAEYIFPRRLKVFNILYVITLCVVICGCSLFIFTDKTSDLNNFGYILAAIGIIYWLFFLVFIRQFLVCPVCHRNIYGFVKANNKAYFLGTIRRILMYHCFTCMYCFAHIKVGSRDIIKEKNLEIINMHQPDFTVRKRK